MERSEGSPEGDARAHAGSTRRSAPSRASERELDDNVGLIEMAEAERTRRIADEGALRSRPRRAGQGDKVETLLVGRGRRQQRLYRDQCRRRRHRGQDWAEMLARMYTRWAERRGFKVSWSRRARAKRPASSRAPTGRRAPNAYGWLKTESGVHRLVRISPFDGNARRQTSVRLRLGLSRGRRQYRDRASTRT